MLVLSRRVGEEIIINDNIRVTVVAVKGDRVGRHRPPRCDRGPLRGARAAGPVPANRSRSRAASDADVPIGVLPAKHADDTLIHSDRRPTRRTQERASRLPGGQPCFSRLAACRLPPSSLTSPARFQAGLSAAAPPPTVSILPASDDLLQDNT